MKIPVIQPRADRDIDEQVEYMAARSPKSALRFLDAIAATLDELLKFPEIGGRCEFSHPSAEGMRMWPVSGFPKHLIFYRPTETHLEIVRILHAARDLSAIFES